MAAHTTGKVIGLARRSARREPMEEISSGLISVAAGLEGDFKGAKHKTRQITILAVEDWREALKALNLDSEVHPWTVRRANLLTQGLRLPRAKGSILSIGDVRLEVTGQTYPCKRMDEAIEGLRKALTPDWRGGLTLKVLSAGTVRLGDTIAIEHTGDEIRRSLPG